MLLFHYTYRGALDAIKSEGISKGEVPLTAHKVINGVWLTSDRLADGHGLSASGPVPIEHIKKLKAQGLMSRDVPEDGSVRLPNKRAIRLTVRIPSQDRDLKKWLSWGRKRLEPEWFETLSQVGGGHAKARTWYVCFRTITPDEIVAIDDLEGREP